MGKKKNGNPEPVEPALTAWETVTVEAEVPYGKVTVELKWFPDMADQAFTNMRAAVERCVDIAAERMRYAYIRDQYGDE